LPFEAIIPSAPTLAAFRADFAHPVTLARVATSADEAKVGSKIELFVSHGFRPDQLPEIEELVAGGLTGIDGVVVRAGLGSDFVTLAGMLDTWCKANGLSVDLNLRVAANNPATNVTDDGAILAAAAEAYACALAYPRLTVMFDPFMDLDRGYFVRHGLVDRRCNLRPAGLAVEALAAFLPCDGASSPALTASTPDGGRALVLESPGTIAAILLPAPGVPLTVGDGLADLLPDALHVVPLDTPWTLSPTLGAAPMGRVPQRVDGPTLLVGPIAGSPEKGPK
ncbi:MAG: hypothetical protein B7Z52_03900, partial [Burkholderiales bacterium 12-64-5]